MNFKCVILSSKIWNKVRFKFKADYTRVELFRYLCGREFRTRKRAVMAINVFEIRDCKRRDEQEVGLEVR
ncbi:unnamed protein product [Moneuplotes crassus]|uniref:Uncharacterized protein n=1 Tax=Euplotes crassus TaxID=5936 RepID=A0AAD1UJJ9_EUPCR|nr:unnamed protein product [Moneuplotes crassus]